MLYMGWLIIPILSFFRKRDKTKNDNMPTFIESLLFNKILLILIYVNAYIDSMIIVRTITNPIIDSKYI